MSKKVYILVFITIGFFMIPSISFACGSGCGNKKSTKTESAESSDTKKVSKSSEKKCCDTSKSSKQNDGCKGKCKHPTCHCITPVLNIVLTPFSDLKLKNNFDFSNKKKSFTFEESNTSSGFYYIWTPPNIS